VNLEMWEIFQRSRSAQFKPFCSVFKEARQQPSNPGTWCNVLACYSVCGGADSGDATSYTLGEKQMSKLRFAFCVCFFRIPSSFPAAGEPTAICLQPHRSRSQDANLELVCFWVPHHKHCCLFGT